MPAVSSLHFQKYLLSKYCDFATRVSKASTGTQSIGIHDVYSFNTELAMHYRAIFVYGFFSAVLLGGSKTRVTGHCSTNVGTTLTPS